MSLFEKGPWLPGVGRVRVQLEVGTEVDRHGGVVRGRVTLTSPSTRSIKGICLELEEAFIEGCGEERKLKKLLLGHATLPAGFTLEPGDERRVEFALQFVADLARSACRWNGGQGRGDPGAPGENAGREPSRFFLCAMAETDDAGFDSSDMKEIALVAAHPA